MKIDKNNNNNNNNLSNKKDKMVEARKEDESERSMIGKKR